MADIKISIAAARVNAGMKQKELADKLGVSRLTLIQWETGKVIPKKSSLYMLADICGIPMENISLPSSLPKVKTVK